MRARPSQLIQLIRSKTFDTFIVFVIFLNSVCMAMADYRAGCLGRDKESQDFGAPRDRNC